MNELKITPRLFQSSEIQLFQMICFKITWKQTNKDCKEEFVDVLCFLNMISAVGHKSSAFSGLPSVHFPYICIFPCFIRGSYTYFKLQECVIYLESFQNYHQLKM